MIATVDFEAAGKQHGHVMVPHSRDDSAWGHVMVPICVIAGGDGPTALLSGGSHGDEYEGPIAIRDLALSLDPSEITGRVILLPDMNTPAVAVGRRCSPIDGGNMNRVYPGNPRGTVTERIAQFVTETLLPMADLVCDLHSGGRTLDFLPFAASHILPDPAQDAACAAAARAFGAPYTVRMREIDDTGMFDGVAERAGKVFVTSELGGAGMARAETVAIARNGLRNLLIHAGILNAAPTPAAAPERRLEMPETGGFAFSELPGLFEPLVDLGTEVTTDQALARIWPTGRTGRRPVPITAARDGLIIGRHVPGLIQPGDCAMVLALPA